MYNNLSWIFILMLQCAVALSHPIQNQNVANADDQHYISNGGLIPTHEDILNPNDDKVISVRITSSVAVGRAKGKAHKIIEHDYRQDVLKESSSSIYENVTLAADILAVENNNETKTITEMTDIPPNLIGANIEFIKQLNAKKEAKEHIADQDVHPFETILKNQQNNENEELLEESSSTIDENDDVDYIEGIPFARKIPSPYSANRLNEKESSDNHNYNETHFLETEELSTNEYKTILGDNQNSSFIYFANKTKEDEEDITTPTLHSSNNESEEQKHTYGNGKNDDLIGQKDDSVAEPSIKSVLEVATKNNENDESIENNPKAVSQQNYFQDFRSKSVNGRDSNTRQTTISFSIVHDIPKPPINYNEPNTQVIPKETVEQQQDFYAPPKIYSEPARIYSEPAKFYSEPAKIYSEPAKIYSEPAKVYSEPAKIYSVPAKFYSEPASLHLDANVAWQQHAPDTNVNTTSTNTIPVTTIANSYESTTSQQVIEQQPEKNYEVNEKESVVTNGRSHGVQESTTEKCKQDNCKVGYVVEGRQFKKYRVEERTSDGFIVGEYGVVRNEDGALRGVRYTADSDASPRLIYDALMKFLQLR